MSAEAGPVYADVKVDAARVAGASQASSRWLFSAPVDLTVFLGSAVAALFLLWVGYQTGVLDDATPEWTWIPAILLIDVAHVYATGFRVYLDVDEFRRRPLLYTLVPVIGLALGMALYSESDAVFWRTLAYLAVFHFVRQQYGWVALYRAKARETDRPGLWLDTAAIYIATLYPLAYWHSNLPRNFWWFIDGDFAVLPGAVARLLEPIYWSILGAYLARSIYLAVVRGHLNPGKDIVVVTTAVCWYVGIVGLNSDYAFTVTNVIIHGVPYLALIYWYGRRRLEQRADSRTFRIFSRGPILFLTILWGLAFIEEMFWDRSHWHEREWLFGSSWDIDSMKFVLIPLLALPQIIHYVLDGFVWRRKSNPDFSLIR